MIDYIKYIDSITSLQKLKLSKSLCDYIFIMDNRLNPADYGFQKVFYDFYLRSRWSLLSNDNIKTYFQIYSDYLSDSSGLVIEDIIVRLQHELKISSYEISIASKMLHTINDENPIYDSRIKSFLRKQGIYMKNETLSSQERLSLIKSDWNTIKKWYKDFLVSDYGGKWIDWFNDSFPQYLNISKIKKIDFIIWVNEGENIYSS